MLRYIILFCLVFYSLTIDAVDPKTEKTGAEKTGAEKTGTKRRGTESHLGDGDEVPKKATSYTYGISISIFQKDYSDVLHPLIEGTIYILDVDKSSVLPTATLSPPSGASKISLLEGGTYIISGQQMKRDPASRVLRIWIYNYNAYVAIYASVDDAMISFKPAAVYDAPYDQGTFKRRIALRYGTGVWSVMNYITMAAKWTRTNLLANAPVGYIPEDIRKGIPMAGVIFPSIDTKYTGDFDFILISTIGGEGPGSSLHEYGHKVMRYIYDAPTEFGGGQHASCAHDSQVPENEGLAFSEGYATGFAAAVSGTGVYQRGPNVEIPIELASCHRHFLNGEERWVAAAIYDAYDTHADGSRDVDDDLGRGGFGDANTGYETNAWMIFVMPLGVNPDTGERPTNMQEYMNNLKNIVQGPEWELLSNSLKYNWATGI